MTSWIEAGFDPATDWDLVGDYVEETDMQNKVSQRLLDLAGRVENSGWTNLTMSSGYSALSGFAPGYCIIGTQWFFRGCIQKTSGSFATSTDVTVVDAAGPLATALSRTINRTLQSDTAGVTCRGQLKSDGSIHFITSGTVGNYYDIGPFSAILTGS